MEAAQAQVQAAQNQAGVLLRDAGADVQAATARRDALQAALDLQRAGSSPEMIAAAEARVGQAEAVLAAAEAALARTSIRAPFAGHVAEIAADVGDTAAPGQVLVVVATLDRLCVRTNDLAELDVVRVAVGQRVVMTPDALPDRSFAGHVVRVDQQSEALRGDVTYPVLIAPNEALDALRWGMTVQVEIDVDNEGDA